jgi:hypothetical protein
MPFDNCLEQERAPGRSCTGAFGRGSGTGKGWVTSEPEGGAIVLQKYFTTYLPHRTDFCYPMTARPISSDNLMRPIIVAVALMLVIGAVLLAAGCAGQPTSANTTANNSVTVAQSILVTQPEQSTCSISGNTTPYIIINPTGTHNAGDVFEINGTTNLKRGERLSVFVYQSPPSPNKKYPSEFTDVRGHTLVQQGDCTTNTWIFSDNLTTLRPSQYTIDVTAENATIEANPEQFNIIDNQTYDH